MAESSSKEGNFEINSDDGAKKDNIEIYDSAVVKCDESAENGNAEEESNNGVDFANLPYLLLSQIFSELNIKERMKCAIVCKNWRDTVYSPGPWDGVFVTPWLCSYSERAPWLKRGVTKKNFRRLRVAMDYHLNWNYSCGCTFRCTCGLILEQEFRFFVWFIEKVLPYAGPGIKKFDLTMSVVTRARILNRILILCPNLKSLDIGHTFIGDGAFEGLWRVNACCHLEYLNFSRCHNLTDKCIYNLVKCWLEIDERLLDDSAAAEDLKFPSIDHDYDDSWDEMMCKTHRRAFPFKTDGMKIRAVMEKFEVVKFYTPRNGRKRIPDLKYINLSGCVQLCNLSLYTLLSCKEALRNLEYLNVSHLAITKKGLSDFVKCCPNLKPEKIHHTLRNWSPDSK